MTNKTCPDPSSYTLTRIRGVPQGPRQHWAATDDAHVGAERAPHAREKGGLKSEIRLLCWDGYNRRGWQPEAVDLPTQSWCGEHMIRVVRPSMGTLHPPPLIWIVDASS